VHGQADQNAKLSEEEANNLVLEHRGWAESIARSVARAWNLDWQMDALDGAAMEALIFCSRRFEPARGIPFKGYARKRIHEGSTDQARKSKGWRKSTTKEDQRARDLSVELFTVFPELREGILPSTDEGGGGEEDLRQSMRQLIMSASLLATKQSMEDPLPDDLVDYKRVVETMAHLEPVHQLLLYRVYWDGLSLRTVATEWETDGLNVMREHKVLIAFLGKSMSHRKVIPRPKVRPGLKPMAVKLKKDGSKGPFSDVLTAGAER
jgi:DNA-directed RNA polymerase specialized sigma subunit